ncbi:MAG: PA2779 family protein [Alphaproteobacteria bacterium]|nr:PA2779 family protein [Alphaproteobacteria bacterium]
MSVVMILTSLPIGLAHAGMVSTKTIIEQQEPRAGAAQQAETSRERVRSFLARDDVRNEMLALGVAPAEAEARIAALTDQEIADIAGRLDQLPAGEGLGTILIVLFIVFGVAVLLDALGMINIFPFVCGPGQCGGPTQAFYQEPAAGPVQAEPYGYDERRPAYRRDQFNDRRAPSGYDSNQYFEPQPPTRNYYDERFGAQRYVR